MKNYFKAAATLLLSAMIVVGCCGDSSEKECAKASEKKCDKKEQVSACCSAKKLVLPTKAELYPNGKFDAKVGKDAYFALMNYHGMPIGGVLETDQFWVSEFGMGDFTSVGMGGIFYVNDLENKYFGHDIFLLPGQMLVEHRHNAVEGGVSKMETWQIRHGSAYFFYEGEVKGECPVTVPASQKGSQQAKAWNLLKVGEIGHLQGIGSWHFIIAGPEGAIITEYATPHYEGALEFSNSKIIF